MNTNLQLFIIESGPAYTNGYLVWDSATGHGAIIDAPLESCAEFLAAIKENSITTDAILLTHTHWDHTGDARALQTATGAKVYMHRDDEYRALDPNGHSIMRLPFQIEPVKADVYLAHEDILAFNGLSISVIHTPGHTEGSVCFYLESDKMLFTGDTLFLESIGRSDLPGGNGDTLIESIRTRLFSLPDDVTVHCGHGPATSIGHERRHNPFLQ